MALHLIFKDEAQAMLDAINDTPDPETDAYVEDCNPILMSAIRKLRALAKGN
jgi:hypothetical protein